MTDCVKMEARSHLQQPVKLHFLERHIYIIGWTSAALYSLYAVLQFSLGKTCCYIT